MRDQNRSSDEYRESRYDDYEDAMSEPAEDSDRDSDKYRDSWNGDHREEDEYGAPEPPRHKGILKNYAQSSVPFGHSGDHSSHELIGVPSPQGRGRMSAPCVMFDLPPSDDEDYPSDQEMDRVPEPFISGGYLSIVLFP